MTTMQNFALGQAIARMYIAAQGISILASEAACDAIMNEGAFAKLGFDQEISKDGRYQISARVKDPAGTYAKHIGLTG